MRQGVEGASATRNSELRGKSGVLDGPVLWAHENFPWLKANHITAASVLLTCVGIHMMEGQHRKGEYSAKKTAVALGFILTGVVGDLADGKKARDERADIEHDIEEVKSWKAFAMGKAIKEIDERVDELEAEKLKHEKRGQAVDSVADGVIESFQCLEAVWTAHSEGNQIGVDAALTNLISTNLPRTARALAERGGVAVPETYKPKDIKFYGTSLGRKVPNYLGTFLNRPFGLPLREVANLWASVGNNLVSLDRIRQGSQSEVSLSEKEMDFGDYRFKRLGVQTLVNCGMAGVASRLLKVRD